MDWNIFWIAFGAIGTTAGTFLAAISIIIALKPYKKRLNINLGMVRYADQTSPEFSIECYNTGECIYLHSIGIYYKGKIIVDCPLVEAQLLVTNSLYTYTLSEEEIDTIKYHIQKSRIKVFDVDIYDVRRKRYRNKMNVEWYRNILVGREDLGVV